MAKKKTSSPKSRSTRNPLRRTAAKSRKTSRQVQAETTQGTCFVLMPFSNQFDKYFDEVFRPAVEAAMLEPLRGDSLFRPGPIMADVWSMIQSTKVLLAELTTKNANVFYELGLAHALGKPVVLVAETMDDVPFDLQSLRVILYDKNDPWWGKILSDSITRALGETLAEPIESVPAMFRKTVKSQAPEQSETARRLAELESRLASFSTSRLDTNVRPDAPYQRFRRQLEIASSNEDIIRLVREALVSGIPSDVIKRHIDRAVFPKEAVEKIWQSAVQGR